MPSDWGEEVLRHKYDPLPEDAPRHRKKSRKRHVRSDHKHEYETVCIDAHDYVISGGRYHFYRIGRRCRICGRLKDYRTNTNQREVPEGMRLFEVDGWDTLFKTRYLSDELEVTDG